MRGLCRIFSASLIAAFAMLTLGACASSDVDPLSLEGELTGSPETEFSFHMVRLESNSEAAMRLAQDGKTPPGAMYRTFANQDGGLILEKRTRLKADCIESASAGEHPTSDSNIINFSFNPSCAKIFGEVTSRSIGKQFAVVLNGEILTAPRINSAITGGAGFIEGNFTELEARQIASDISAAASKEVK